MLYVPALAVEKRNEMEWGRIVYNNIIIYLKKYYEDINIYYHRVTYRHIVRL